jgi:tRNA A-37 threonylcarbamoyl transferase component Bud32
VEETGTRFASIKAAPRWSVLAPVVQRAAPKPANWSTLNISETGMFVSGVPLLRPGAEVDVSIVLPSDEGPNLEITSRVQVVWTRQRAESSRTRPPGMGMRFLGIDAKTEAALKAYLAQLPTSQNTTPAPTAAVETPPPAPVEVRAIPIAAPPPPAREVARAVQKGDKLGAYTIVDRIGAGGMGDVYLAEHTLLGRRVALKLLKDEHVHDRVALRRFYDEARLVNQISHDNIVQITDLVVGDDQVFIVMELLVGTNLSQELLRNGPMPLSRIKAIGKQLCSALDAVHQAGIVHRDLKPQNIMLVRYAGTPDFVKLLDFGIAKLRRGAELDGPRTLAGEVIGSPGYMAPEQLLGEPVDARTDIYSLGVVLFAMITGQLPFKASGWAEMILRQIQDAPRAPSTVTDKKVPKALDNIVVRCLDKNPNNRPGTASAIATVLQHLVG